MKYEFIIRDKDTNDILFETKVEGVDRKMCAIKATRLGREAGFDLITVGKSVAAVPFDKPSPYKFTLKREGYSSQERYDATNTTRVSIKLNKKTEKDILEWLDRQEKKQTAIKNLIRADIEKERLNKEG